MRINNSIFALKIVINALISLFFVANTFAEVQYDKGMYVVITGAGMGPFTFQRGAGSVAVVVDGNVLQFDAGPRTREHLILADILPEYKIDYLFFTHLHADHTTDFVDMNAWRDSTFNHGYKIFGPPSTKFMVKAANDFIKVHDRDGEAMAKKVPRMYEAVKQAQKLSLHDVEEIHSTGGIVLDASGIKVTATSVPHMMAKDGHSYAYRVDTRYGSVVISGDTSPSLNVVELAKNADILVHEIAHYEPNMKPESYRNWTKVKLGDSLENYKANNNNQLGHSTPVEVGKVAQRAGVKKLVAYHTPQFTFIPSEQKRFSYYGYSKEQISIEMKSEFIFSIKKNFSGSVVMGEPLMVFEVGEERKL